MIFMRAYRTAELASEVLIYFCEYATSGAISPTSGATRNSVALSTNASDSYIFGMKHV
jgi:hypothetical protein